MPRQLACDGVHEPGVLRYVHEVFHLRALVVLHRAGRTAAALVRPLRLARGGDLRHGYWRDVLGEDAVGMASETELLRAIFGDAEEKRSPEGCDHCWHGPDGTPTYGLRAKPPYRVCCYCDIEE